jgi:hypothetical protein
MNRHEMHELLYQALETEQGGVQVYGQDGHRCGSRQDGSKGNAVTRSRVPDGADLGRRERHPVALTRPS